MPWKAQECPFCDKKYANKKGLINHLLNYTGQLRFPADGYHDISKIKKLPLLKEYFRDENPERYQCPECQSVINHRKAFLFHLEYLGHGESIKAQPRPSKRSQKSSYDTDLCMVWERKGIFPFLHLPREIRDMIYEHALCFESVTFTDCQSGEAVILQGQYLQHNPKSNLLSLLAANRQIYHEARRVFYGYNNFIFLSELERWILIFLIAIGRENALLLRRIEWPSETIQTNQIGFIRSHIIRSEDQTVAVADTPERNIWNDEDQYRAFEAALWFPRRVSQLAYWNSRRLLRLDADDLRYEDYHTRYLLTVECAENSNSRKKRFFRAGYEMYSRSNKGSDKGDYPTDSVLLENLRKYKK